MTTAKNFPQQLDTFLQQLRTASDRGAQKQILLDYFKFLIAAESQCIISRKQAAYYICGTFTLQITKHPDLEPIIDLACDLELPDHHIDGEPQARWQEMVNLIKNPS